MQDEAVARLFQPRKGSTERAPPAAPPAAAKPREDKPAKETKKAPPAEPEPEAPAPDLVASAKESAESLSRTVFVGNLPVDTTRKALTRHFSSFGPVESARLRSASAVNPKMPQRAAVITGTVAGDAISAYIVFKERTAALVALKSSGAEAFGRHLRIAPATNPGESSSASERHDTKRSVFLGNLPFDIAEETLWSLFGDCGKVTYVRLVREPRTQQGKGFGYVGFDDAGAVERALSLHGTPVACAPPDPGAKGAKGVSSRAIRVYRCSGAKSNARLIQSQQTPSGSKGAGQKRPRTPAHGGAEEEDGGGGGYGQKPRKGWMDRERGRLLKKEKGKATKRGGGVENAAAAAQRADKVAAALQRSKKGGGGAKGGGGGGGAKGGIKKSRGRIAKATAKVKATKVRMGVRGGKK